MSFYYLLTRMKFLTGYQIKIESHQAYYSTRNNKYGTEIEKNNRLGMRFRSGGGGQPAGAGAVRSAEPRAPAAAPRPLAVAGWWWRRRGVGRRGVVDQLRPAAGKRSGGRQRTLRSSVAVSIGTGGSRIFFRFVFGPSGLSIIRSDREEEQYRTGSSSQYSLRPLIPIFA
jgi:hypothetical protein